MPRGAPGHLATAYVSLASAHGKWQEALKAEDSARRAIADKNARMVAREAIDLREKPLVDLCKQAT